MPFDQKLAHGDTDSIPWAVGEELQASLDRPLTVVGEHAFRLHGTSVSLFRPDVTDRFGKNRWRCTECVPLEVLLAALGRLSPPGREPPLIVRALLWVVPYRALEAALLLVGKLRRGA